MDAPVGHQVGLDVEALATLQTGVWPLPRVNALVRLAVRPTVKGLAAYCAAEGLFARVTPLVAEQLGAMLEPLPTIRTREWLLDGRVGEVVPATPARIRFGFLSMTARRVIFRVNFRNVLLLYYKGCVF